MKDNFSIRGEVLLVDDLGNKLIDDHNMVVLGGRRFIASRVLGQNTTKNLSINKIQFGYSEVLNLVEESTIGIDGSSNNRTFNLDETATVRDNLNNIGAGVSTYFACASSDLNDTDTSPRITYQLYLKNVDLGMVNQLGLFISNDKLFSKLNFEDVVINKDREYLLTYTLYF